jgi:3D (Asp-Asp-Asp) domain-containing protein
VGYFDQRIERLLHEKIELTEEIVELQYKLEEFTTDPMSWIRDNYEKYNCEVTAYSPSVDECDDTPFIAASGREVDDWTIAVSQNMRKDGWNFGDFIYIPDHNKFYKINDVMNRRYTKRVDIFRWTKKEARDFGFCELDMYLIN